jgi:hypothetical protein
MRIRSADFIDGTFEEVRSSLNVSSEGCYFLTFHDRYYVGMRLRIAPANEPRNESAWEERGVVVRVDRRGSGFGVAVAFAKTVASRGQTMPASPGKRERRSGVRQLFVTSADIIDVRTDARSRMRTADLSTQGCYIDTLNPLPLDATVRLQIQKENVTMELRCRVISSHPGSGDGAGFRRNRARTTFGTGQVVGE